MTRPSMQVAIDTLEERLGARFQQREPWCSVHTSSLVDLRPCRADDVAAIRGYIRAIRVLREASQ